jgi:hypothetical protein
VIVTDEYAVPHRMSCSHPACHTSLTDEQVIYCPHDMPFCGNCTFEDICLMCALEASRAHIADPCAASAYTWPAPCATCADTTEVWVRPRREHDTGEYVTAPCPDCSYPTRTSA